MLILHDYNSDGITFLMKIECTEKKLKELDDTIYEIVMYVKNKLHDTYPSIKSSFTTGYMFVDQEVLRHLKKQLVKRINKLLLLLKRK